VIQFYQTPMGKRFFEATVPDLTLQVKRVANALDRLLDILEASRAPATAPRDALATDHPNNPPQEP
jgi:hypothetical protein